MLPKLITEGDTLEEANSHVRDAFEAVLEIYAEQNRPLPTGIELPSGEVVWSEVLPRMTYRTATHDYHAKKITHVLSFTCDVARLAPGRRSARGPSEAVGACF